MFSAIWPIVASMALGKAKTSARVYAKSLVLKVCALISAFIAVVFLLATIWFMMAVAYGAIVANLSFMAAFLFIAVVFMLVRMFYLRDQNGGSSILPSHIPGQKAVSAQLKKPSTKVAALAGASFVGYILARWVKKKIS